MSNYKMFPELALVFVVGAEVLLVVAATGAGTGVGTYFFSPGFESFPAFFSKGFLVSA